MSEALYIQPVSIEGPGLIEEVRPARISTDLRRPAVGQPVPALAGDYGAIVVLGGPMGVYETQDHPWIETVLDLLRDALDRGVPVLGICLGSQLLAAAAGAPVAPMGYQEIGWAPISLQPEASSDPLLRHFTHGDDPVVFHLHGDRWELPEEACLLASSERCDHQMFRLNECHYGFQCHLEVAPEVPGLWAGAYAEELARIPTAPSRDEIERTSLEHGPHLVSRARETFRRFWELVR